MHSYITKMHACKSFSFRLWACPETTLRVAFKPVNRFRPIVGHWRHTFIITLPSLPVITEFHPINCRNVEPQNRTFCERAKHIVNTLACIQFNMSQVIRSEIQNMQRILPYRPFRDLGPRETRAWVPFLGDILKTVTGTATTKDLQKTADAMEQIRQTTADAYVQFSQVENDVASLTKVMNDKMELLQRLVVGQRSTMQQQLTLFSQEVEDIYQITELLPHSMAKVTGFISALVHCVEFKDALLDAVNGRLNTFVVETSVMRDAMRQIDTALLRLHGSLKIAYSSLSEAYQSSDFIMHRYGRDIYITVKFPITMHPQPFMLYQIRTFPVRMPDNTQHITVLDTKTVAFGYDPQAEYFLEFKEHPKIRHYML